MEKWIEVDNTFYNLATASMIVEDGFDVWVYMPGASASDASEKVNGRFEIKVKWTPISLHFQGSEADEILSYVKNKSCKVDQAKRSVLLGGI